MANPKRLYLYDDPHGLLRDKSGLVGVPTKIPTSMPHATPEYVPKPDADALLAFIRDDLSDLQDAVGAGHWIERRRLEVIAAYEEATKDA